MAHRHRAIPTRYVQTPPAALCHIDRTCIAMLRSSSLQRNHDWRAAANGSAARFSYGLTPAWPPSPVCGTGISRRGDHARFSRKCAFEPLGKFHQVMQLSRSGSRTGRYASTFRASTASPSAPNRSIVPDPIQPGPRPGRDGLCRAVNCIIVFVSPQDSRPSRSTTRNPSQHRGRAGSCEAHARHPDDVGGSRSMAWRRSRRNHSRCRGRYRMMRFGSWRAARRRTAHGYFYPL